MLDVPFANLGFAALGDGPEGLPTMRRPLTGGVDGADVLVVEIVLRIVAAAEHVVQEQAIRGNYSLEGTRFSVLFQILVTLEGDLPDPINVFALPEPLHPLHLRVDLEKEP